MPASVEQQARNSFAHIERRVQGRRDAERRVQVPRVSTDLEAIPEIVKVLAEKLRTSSRRHDDHL